MLKIALKADALRYASIFVTDHVVLPVSAARSVYPYHMARFAEDVRPKLSKRPAKASTR